MTRIGAAIAIAEEPAVDEPVVIGALAVLDWGSGRDAERDLGQDSRFENALGVD
jgi:hypothetical protein